MKPSLWVSKAAVYVEAFKKHTRVATGLFLDCRQCTACEKSMVSFAAEAGEREEAGEGEGEG